MSKENVFKLFAQASGDPQLASKLKAVDNPTALSHLASEYGLEFSAQDVQAAIADLQRRPGFFGAIAEAIVSIFGPTHDDYPNIGVQPFSGDPSSDK